MGHILQERSNNISIKISYVHVEPKQLDKGKELSFVGRTD